MKTSSTKWIVEIRDTPEPFEREWRELVRADNATPFQSFGWMSLLYRQIAVNKLAKPVVALVRHADGRPAALFPLLKQRRCGLTWLCSDARPVDYCAPVFDPALRRGVVPEIIDAVLAAVPDANLLYCNKMPARFQGRANPMIELPNTARLRFSAWVLRLKGRSPEELLAAQSEKHRDNIRRAARRLSKAHTVAFDIRFGDEITAADFETFLALRSESFHEKGRNDILDDPDWCGLYRSLVAGKTDDIKPWMARLTADGEIIAVLLGFAAGKHPVAIMPASKTGPWKSYSPGLLLFQEVISHFHGIGAAVFDLSVGDMPYKRRFGCDEQPLYDALFPRGLAGRAFYAFWRLKTRLRERMKPIAAGTH